MVRCDGVCWGVGLGKGSCGCGESKEQEVGGAGDVTKTGFVTAVAPATTVSVGDGEEREERAGDVASAGPWEVVSLSRVRVSAGRSKASEYPLRRENSSSAIQP